MNPERGGAVAGHGRGRLLARTPLRVRLVALLLVLVVAALAGSAVVALATMRSYLAGRVDAQLRAVAEQPLNRLTTTDTPAPGGDNGPRGGPGRRGDNHHGHLPSAYVVETTDTTGRAVYGPTSNLVDTTEPLPRLPTLTSATSRSQGTRSFTVGAVSGSGQWRVLTKPVTLSDGSAGTLLVAQSMGDVETTVGHLATLLAGIGAVAVVILAGVGYFVVRASLRPLGRVEATAAAIAGGDLSQRVPTIDPRTEIGQLSSALNTMLGEIEHAFAERAASEAAARRSEEHSRRSEAAARQSEERMREFVANASHELRTPLTTIRGFAELYRQGAAATPEDAARFMERIEGEAMRMGLLVEDLLLLARLDQERPLAQAPVDLLALANDAVHDARAVHPNRPITLEVGSTEPPPIVIGDEMRLRQVLSNMVTNATVHTPAGTPVVVGVRTGPASQGHGTIVVVTVSDEGPGLRPDDAARIFERFYRVDAARSRGGSGLGLAIVAALVAGHGGTVSVDTEPGRGARFRIELPVAA